MATEKKAPDSSDQQQAPAATAGGQPPLWTTPIVLQRSKGRKKRRNTAAARRASNACSSASGRRGSGSRPVFPWREELGRRSRDQAQETGRSGSGRLLERQPRVPQERERHLESAERGHEAL
jgi:hypothetical protein